MNKIACYGASNTYGFDPRGYFGSRYPADCRWPEVLAALTGYTVLNWGENGRELPHSQAELEYLSSLLEANAPLDLLILDLGINDLLTHYPPSVSLVTGRLETFLDWLKEHCPALSVLVLLPGPLNLPEERLMEAFRQLPPAMEAVLQARGIPCLDLNLLILELCFDGIHLTELGQCTLAAELADELADELQEKGGRPWSLSPS